MNATMINLAEMTTEELTILAGEIAAEIERRSAVAAEPIIPVELTTEAKIAMLKSECPDAVYSISPWGKRHYLNFRHAQKGARGDQTRKVYFDDRGVVVYEKGKGTSSPESRQDLYSVLDFIEAKGWRIETRD